ncbi:semaphorin-3E isoform X2 [Syngnathoides biaculeatus]|uniref:semaphorin-3E isoform X2 n=1 Tax=Syngnathoides biaculeatus TaxID=300417 RepID=UPI002ADD645E|nr:semaphorin-3E isoform X2 [Syngnathoides biaculeatus]
MNVELVPKRMEDCLRTSFLALMISYLFLSTVETANSVYPRIRLSHKELWQLNRTWVFRGSGVPLRPQTVLLDEGHERLYVGAKNALFSLSLDQVNAHHREIQWASTETQIEECLMKGREKMECANYIKVLQQYNQTHLLVCGTASFNPICALVHVGHTAKDKLFALQEESVASGRGRCPFNHNSPCTSTLAGGELYVGLYTDYWENDAALCRLNNRTYTRTERDDRQQLNEPRFVGSAVIPDNDDRDDDKVYFFFTEREADIEGVHKAVYTRVGRVCANDQGGQRMLVNRWSSFLKTRLICSVAGTDGIDTHFDLLEDVYVLKKKDEKNPEIFGLFSTTSAVFKGYAVCVYHMDDIRAAFNGPFAFRERPEHHWTPSEDRVPYPRPGSCASKVNGGGFSSSKEFPDEVLRFVRSHPVMYRPVLPQHHRPVFLQTEPSRRKLTQIAVDRVQAQDGHYHVLYIGTDDGLVLKVITIDNKDANTIEEVLLEELQVFEVPAPIKEIVISPKRQQLYVSSDAGVAQVKLHQCALYGSECADCCLARDPYCAWDGLTCSSYYPPGVYTKRRFRRQDIRHGNAVQLCNGLQIDGEQWHKSEEKTVFGVEGNGTLLSCVPRSLHAKVLWFLQNGDDKREVHEDDRVIRTSHGLLLLSVTRSDAGVYVCQTVEHGYVHTLLRVTLRVLSGELLESSIGPKDGPGDRSGAPCRSPANPPAGPGFSSRTLVPASLPGPHSRQWYKEFLQLLDYRDAQRVEEYCERVWWPDKKRKKSKKKFAFSSGEKKAKARAADGGHRAPRHALDT